VGVIALVENRAGLEEIEAICAVEGLLALLIGPFDLAVSLGFGGDYRHPEVLRTIDRMLAAAKANTLPSMVPVFNPDPAEARRQRDDWWARGASMFVVGTDKILFASTLTRYASALR
jgi:2-keto-3-deoxy-L-rhamnonate aldolase RhmA